MMLAGFYASVCVCEREIDKVREKKGRRCGEKHMAAPPVCLLGPPP